MSRNNSNPVGTILFAILLVCFKVASWMLHVLFDAVGALFNRLAHGSR